MFSYLISEDTRKRYLSQIYFSRYQRMTGKEKVSFIFQSSRNIKCFGIMLNTSVKY